MEDRKKRSKILNIISNVLFGIVMVLLVIFMIYGFGNIANNKVPSFFGQSYVRILSSSMNDPAYKDGELLSDGFEKGDVAVLKKVNISEIEIGDIIAFYYCPIVQSDFNGSDNVLDFKTGEESYDTNIIFHQVVDIQVDSQGYTWFQTQGTSNAAADKFTRADYVVGVYTDSGLAGFLEFISSSVGIIVLVVVPSCIVLFMLLLNIIDTVDKMIKQKREQEEMEAALMQTINNNQEIKNSTGEAPKDRGLSESSMAEFEKQMKKIENEGGTAQAKTQAAGGDTKPVPPKPPVKPDISKSTTSAQAKPADSVQATSSKPAPNAEVKKDTAAKAAAKPAVQADAKVTQAAENKTAVKTEVKAEEKPKAAGQTEAKAESAKPAAKTEQKVEIKPAAKTDTKTETKADAKTETKAETKKTDVKAESKDSAKADTKSSSSKAAKSETKTSTAAKDVKADKTASAKTSTTKASTKTEEKPAAKADTKAADNKAKTTSQSSKKSDK